MINNFFANLVELGRVLAIEVGIIPARRYVDDFYCPYCHKQYKVEEFMDYSGSVYSVSCPLPSWAGELEETEVCVPCWNQLARKLEPRPWLIRRIAETKTDFGQLLYTGWHTTV